jgi:hypothetical protein
MRVDDRADARRHVGDEVLGVGHAERHDRRRWLASGRGPEAVSEGARIRVVGAERSC